jgi:pyruvate kinase
VVVATQMLESMISSPVPTRAEVSDVAIAVYEASDAIMLSAESAAGKYPVEAVRTMNSIAEATEHDPTWRPIVAPQRPPPEATGADAITSAAASIGETLNVAAMVCLTQSGSTGLRAARERPFVPVIALTASPAMARRLALVWGIHCVVAEDARDVDDMVDRGCRAAFTEGYARPGQRVVVVGGVPFGTPGSTNMLRIAFVGADGSGAL